MKKLATTLVAVLGIGGIAAAADLPDDPIIPPPAPERFDWSGFYVGGTLGYGWSEVDISLVPFLGRADPDGDGFVAGGYIGYNYAFHNNVIVGVEGDIVYSDIDGDSAMRFPAPAETWTSEIEWMTSIRARLGYAVTNRALLFVTGGWAWADYKGKIYNGLGSVGFREAYSETFDGYTLGAGGEFAFARNWVAKLEYRFSDFGDERFSLPATVPFDVDLKVHEVRGGLAYKF